MRRAAHSREKPDGVVVVSERTGPRADSPASFQENRSGYPYGINADLSVGEAV